MAGTIVFTFFPFRSSRKTKKRTMTAVQDPAYHRRSEGDSQIYENQYICNHTFLKTAASLVIYQE